MKKLMTACAACMIAGLVSAEVSSQNIVGYNTSPVTPGFNMVSVNFDSVTNSSAGIDLKVVFPPTTANLVGSTTATGADEIQVWDNTTKTYAGYFLYYTTKTTTLSTLNYTWRVNQTTPANVLLKSGDTVWFNKKGVIAAEFAIAGQVPTLTSKNRTLTQGFNMIGNLYPTDWDANLLGTTWWSTSGATGSTTATGADEIQVWDNTAKTYAGYFLYYTTKTTTLSTLNWTWRVNQTTVAPADFLKLGCGAWYNRKTATQVTFPVNRPYSL